MSCSWPIIRYFNVTENQYEINGCCIAQGELVNNLINSTHEDVLLKVEQLRGNLPQSRLVIISQISIISALGRHKFITQITLGTLLNYWLMFNCDSSSICPCVDPLFILWSINNEFQTVYRSYEMIKQGNNINLSYWIDCKASHELFFYSNL